MIWSIRMRTFTHIRIAVCIAILFTVLAQPSPAKACSCVEEISILDEIAQYDAIFTGKVLRIVDNYKPIFSTLDSILFKFGFRPYFFNENGKYWDIVSS